mmetsp:Transcript_130089/g.324313  ORF Transcript_130089/g.324313 Transcript_130089/m.324313 type:complete len:255 (-) Transcript_130089:584-1348(-)
MPSLRASALAAASSASLLCSSSLCAARRARPLVRASWSSWRTLPNSASFACSSSLWAARAAMRSEIESLSCWRNPSSSFCLTKVSSCCCSRLTNSSSRPRSCHCRRSISPRAACSSSSCFLALARAPRSTSFVVSSSEAVLRRASSASRLSTRAFAASVRALSARSSRSLSSCSWRRRCAALLESVSASSRRTASNVISWSFNLPSTAVSSSSCCRFCSADSAAAFSASRRLIRSSRLCAAKSRSRSCTLRSSN